MAKRSHTQLQVPIDSDDQPLHKSRSSRLRRHSLPDDMGEFEDAWEDEIEEEDVAQNSTNDSDGSYTPLLNIQERLIVISCS